MFKGLKFLFDFSWKHNKKYIIFLALNQLVIGILPFTTILFPKFIIDEFIGERRINTIITYLVVFSFVIFILKALNSLLSRQIFKERMIVYNEFQIYLSTILVESDYEQIENKLFLDTKEKAQKFIYANGQGFGFVLDRAFNIMGKIFVFIGISAILARLNPLILLVFIGAVLLNNYFQLRSKKIYAETELEKAVVERQAQYYLNVVNDFRYGKELRVNGLLDWIKKKILFSLNNSLKFYNKQMNLLIVNGIVSSFFDLLQNLISFSYVIYSLFKNYISIGDFSMYISTISTFSSAMNEVMDSITDIRQFNVYYESVEQYLSIRKTLRENTTVDKIKEIDYIEFRNVYFTYGNNKNYVLKNINLRINKGKKFSIVGENGAGKTTFIKLLLRLYKPSKGEIFYNGININDIDYDLYLSLFSTVFQDFVLFSTSIKENISFDTNADNKKIENILNDLNLSSMLSKLKGGINTSVYKDFDEEGFEPSGGQGQKIAIARAIYKNSPIVILDEPTAALDPRAEFEIYNNFNDITKGKTAIYISHRLSSTRFSDEILVFKNGEIVQQGNHELLITKDGLYRELFMMQAEFYE